MVAVYASPPQCSNAAHALVGMVAVMYLLRMVEKRIWEQFWAQQVKGTEIRVHLWALKANSDLWKCGKP